MGLISIVYVSEATKSVTDSDLKDILEIARITNQALNITGMLLHRDKYFIQVLEGDEQDVIPLYKKIAQDPRHTRVFLVYKTEIKARAFENWSMGFNRLEYKDLANLPGYTDFMDRKIDKQFWENNSKQLASLLTTFSGQSAF